MRFIKWLCWTVTYWFRRRPTDLDAVLAKGRRCRWPWKKFRPYVRHNDDGNCWEVYFTGEYDYTVHRPLDVQCHIGRETGDIVGLTIRDETLACKKTEDMDQSPVGFPAGFSRDSAESLSKMLCGETGEDMDP